VKRLGAFRGFLRGGGTAVFCTLLALGVSEWRRWADMELQQQRIADDTVKRIVRAINQQGLKTQALYYWAGPISDKLRVPRPMEVEDDVPEIPLRWQHGDAPPSAGTFAGEFPAGEGGER
jgi:hypothetical protein